MIVPILTIFVGALNAAAGTQELVVQGIFNNQRIPLTGGTLGAVAGALLVAAGVAPRLADCPALPVRGIRTPAQAMS